VEERVEERVNVKERNGKHRRVIKREELVGERNRREGKDARGITVLRQQSTEIPQNPRLTIAVFLG
jgi:hypothetical protein